MPMEFPFTKHMESVLRGRRMFKGEKLLCSAEHCLFETDAKTKFGREIEVKGEAVCPYCRPKVTAKYPDDLEFEDSSQKPILKCPVCRQKIPISLIKWTQIVVSKHHGKNHLYFHKECYDEIYYDSKGHR